MVNNQLTATAFKSVTDQETFGSHKSGAAFIRPTVIGSRGHPSGFFEVRNDDEISDIQLRKMIHLNWQSTLVTGSFRDQCHGSIQLQMIKSNLQPSF